MTVNTEEIIREALFIFYVLADPQSSVPSLPGPSSPTLAITQPKNIGLTVSVQNHLPLESQTLHKDERFAWLVGPSLARVKQNHSHIHLF